MKLTLRELWLVAEPGPLLPQVLNALASQPAEPLRWAITAAEPLADGTPGRRRLRIEAVFLCP